MDESDKAKIERLQVIVDRLLRLCEAAEEAIEDRMDNASDPQAMDEWQQRCEKVCTMLREAIEKAGSRHGQ